MFILRVASVGYPDSRPTWVLDTDETLSVPGWLLWHSGASSGTPPLTLLGDGRIALGSPGAPEISPLGIPEDQGVYAEDPRVLHGVRALASSLGIVIPDI